MSPEQVRGEEVDGRSDLFSVGSMLCELLSGRRPFDGETSLVTLYRIAHEEPLLDLPPGPEYARFLPVLKRALARNPEERFATSAEFADALSNCLDDVALTARRKSALRGDQDSGTATTGKIKTTRPLPDAAPEARPTPETSPRTSAPRPDPSGLFRILRDVYVGGKSGHVHFTSGRSHRSLRIAKGQITHAISDTDGEHLGEVLVRYGVISQRDLERALEAEKRLGPVLSGMGLLDRDGLEEALGLHVREILFAMIEGTGSHTFEELADSASESEIACKLSTGQLILEATRRVLDPEMVRQVLGDPDRILALSNDPLLGSQRITLTPTDGFVLSRIDGTLSARDVISLSPVPPEDTERSLFGLICTGMVDYKKKEEQTSRTRPNPVPPTLRHEGGTARPAPATGPESATQEPSPPAVEAPARVAAQTIGEAEGLFAKQRYEDVIQKVEPLVSQVDGPLKTRAAILLARSYMKSENGDKHAERVLLGLIGVDPRCIPAYLLLGALYRSGNQIEHARRVYQKVLELEPGHRGAAAELGVLGDEP
jgi:tetratricopeptide (TPR) repeat protein